MACDDRQLKPCILALPVSACAVALLQWMVRWALDEAQIPYHIGKLKSVSEDASAATEVGRLTMPHNQTSSCNLHNQTRSG